MNPAMAVRARGRWSRSRPCNSSATGVVAARMMDADTPSVPLATMFQAAHSPGCESETPSTSTRGEDPSTGRNTAKPRNGTSIRSRRTSVRRGTDAITATAAITTPYAANAQNASRGVATTASTKTRSAAILSCGGARWTTVEPGISSPSVPVWPGWPPLTSGPAGRLRAGSSPPRPADDDEEPARQTKGDGDPDEAGEAPAEPIVVDAPDRVPGGRPVVERVGLRVAGEALVDGHLVEPVRLAAGLGAHDEGEEEREEEAPGEEDPEAD